MKINSFILVNNKKYEYSIDPQKNGTTFFICKAAKINDDYLNEDIPHLIVDLPHLIIAEEDFKGAHKQVIRFRVSTKEKKIIQKNALKYGYKDVSKYLKDISMKH
jgi:hypothetical protein